MTKARAIYIPRAHIRDLLRQDQWTDYALNAGWTTVTTGSGSVVQSPRHMLVRTQSTAPSTAAAYHNSSSGFSRGRDISSIDFGKYIVVHVGFAIIANTANGVCRVTLGKAGGTIGALAEKGIGIQVNNLALTGIAHDGATLRSQDLATSLTANTLYIVSIVSGGNGRVEWLVDGARKGAITNGPTGLKSDVTLQVEADNGGDAANQAVRVSFIKVYVEQ